MTERRMIAALRAARAALGWTQRELADRSGLALASITRMEAGGSSPRLGTLEAVRGAVESAGVTIVDNEPRGGFTLLVDLSSHDKSSKRLP